MLPFENLSAAQENAFFADGVQDEILTDLAKVADLKVISRTSVMQYKSAVKRNLREIANALGVAHVVEGSVQRAGNRVRVSAQLIDAKTDTNLWAERYDRDLADVFAIQSEIAKKIADQLNAEDPEYSGVITFTEVSGSGEVLRVPFLAALAAASPAEVNSLPRRHPLFFEDTAPSA